MHRKFFYKRLEVNGEDFPSEAQIKIPFTAQRLIISNDSEDSDIAFSFDKGGELAGELFQKDTPIVFDGLEENQIWLKKIAGPSSTQVRVWAWRKYDV